MAHGITRAVAMTLVLAGVDGAQSLHGRTFMRVDKPLRTVTLDAETGTVTRGPLLRERAATTVLDFYNNDLSGFVGVDTGGGFCEWFDAGVKGWQGNVSDCFYWLAAGRLLSGASARLNALWQRIIIPCANCKPGQACA